MRRSGLVARLAIIVIAASSLRLAGSSARSIPGNSPFLATPDAAGLAPPIGPDDFVAWHSLNSGDHKAHMDQYASKGFRFISLSIYGDPHNPLYAAVMLKRPVIVAQREFHGMNVQQMQTTFDTQAKEGFGPVIITATGPAASPAFAAVFQPMSQIPLTRTNLPGGSAGNSNTFQGMNAQAEKDGSILRWAGIYGDASNPRYIGIWTPNPDKTVWNSDGTNETAEQYQERFNAQTSGWARPAFVTLSGAQRYLSVFVDNEIGEYVARHNLTPADYQTEFNKWVKQGFFPLLVQGGGAGAGVRIAALFTKRETPLARHWNVTGSPANAPIDQAMEKLMKQYNVRGASLAIVKGKKLVLARGYTWAEPGYPLTEPTTVFRVASCSKTITAIAIHQLIAEGKLKLTDHVQDILHLKTPTGGEPVDPRFNQITVQNLLEQDSGLVTEYTGEDPQVAAAFHKALPATQEETGSYMMLKHMEANPGALKKYSNFGYWMLGRVVSKLRGNQYFIEAIRQHISDPLGITRLRVSRSLASAQAPDEARYHSPDLVLQRSVMSPGQPLVPRDYGDESMEKMEPSGGLSVAAVDYARILAALNIKSKNQPLLADSEITSMMSLASKSYRGHGFDGMSQIRPGIFNGQKGGLLETSQDSIYYTTGGISFIVCWNTVGVGGDWYPNFPEVVNAARNTNWSPVDLFPTYGMPSF